MISSKKKLALKILLGLAVATQGMGSGLAYAEEGAPDPDSGEFANIQQYYKSNTVDNNAAEDAIYHGSDEVIIHGMAGNPVMYDTVDLKDGTYNKSIYMAATDAPMQTGNTLNIKGGTYAAWTEIGSGSAPVLNADGTIDYSKTTNETWAKTGLGTINLFSGTFGEGLTLRGQTLNVHGKDFTVGHLKQFQRINFFVPSDAANDNTMLNLTVAGGTDTLAADDLKPVVRAYFSGDSALNNGEHVNLIHVTNATHGTLDKFQLGNTNQFKSYMGVSKEFVTTLGLSDDKKTITATINGSIPADDSISSYYMDNISSTGKYMDAFDVGADGNKIVDDNSFAKNNVITLGGGTFVGSVYMAKDSNSDVGNNTINITPNGDFTGMKVISAGVPQDIYGIDNNWDRINSGTINLHSSYPDYSYTMGENTWIKGGTLNVFGKDLRVGHLGNFKTINFFAPIDITNGDTMLTLTGTDYNSLQHVKSNVNAYFHAASNINTGDSIILLDAKGSGLGTFETLTLPAENVTSKAYQGVSKEFTTSIKLSDDKKQVIATIGGTSGDDTEYYPPYNPDNPEEPSYKPNDIDNVHTAIVSGSDKEWGAEIGASIMSSQGLIPEESGIQPAKIDVSGGTVKTAIFHDVDNTSNKAFGIYSNPTDAEFNEKDFEGEIAVADGSVGTVKDNLIIVAGGTFKDGITINAGRLLGTDSKAGDNHGAITLTKADFKGSAVLVADTLNIAPMDAISSYSRAAVEEVQHKYTVNHLVGTKDINFYLSTANKAGDTVLTLTDAQPVIGLAADEKTTVNGYLSGNSNYKKYDQIKLLTVTNPQANLNGFELGKTGWYNGVSTIQDILLTKNDNSIVATVGATPDTLRYETKALAETNMASIASINNNADVLVDMGYSSAAEAVANLKNADSSAANTFAPYAAIGYSKLKQNSGSYVNTKGVGFNIGFAKEISSGGSKMIFGPFVEYGRGSYDSHLEDQCDTRGDGKTRSVGIGAMIRSENNDGMYYEGSLRFGRVTTDFDSVNMVPDLGIRCQYDTTNNYYGAHVGIGKVLNLSDKSKLDVYGKLFLTQMEGHTVHLSTGENYEFDNVNSIRSRLGFRYTTNIGEKSKFYGGLAWQHEFDGTSNATYLHPTDPSRNLNTPSPSVKGNTAMLELGVLLANSDNFSVDLGLRGYAGKQQGSAVNARFNWTF